MGVDSAIAVASKWTGCKRAKEMTKVVKAERAEKCLRFHQAKVTPSKCRDNSKAASRRTHGVARTHRISGVVKTLIVQISGVVKTHKTSGVVRTHGAVRIHR